MVKDEDPYWKGKEGTIRIKRKEYGVWISLKERGGFFITEEEIPIVKKVFKEIRL